MHHQLEPWRLEHDVIVITSGLPETEHVGIERGNPVESSRKQDGARP
jgi:hypothetical protein